MDNIEACHNKKMVAAEYVGFRLEAFLFKSIPMIISFCCHEQHWDVSKSEYGCCRNRWFRIRNRPLQISTDYPRFWLSWTTLRFSPKENGTRRNRWFHVWNRPLQISTDVPRIKLSWTALRRFTMRKWLLQKLAVSNSKKTSSHQYRSYRVFCAMDNIETFQHEKIFAVENVGVRFEADLFKSVQMILDCCCHWQHWHVSP